MVTLFMLRDSPTLDFWPCPLLIQTHISPFGRAQPWHLFLCVLSHDMHVTGLVCVLLHSHARCVATAGRPEADAQSHKCRGCLTSFSKQLLEEEHLHHVDLILSGLAPIRTASLGKLEHLSLVNRLPLPPGTLLPEPWTSTKSSQAVSPQALG